MIAEREISEQETAVAERFDALHERFPRAAGPADARLLGLIAALSPLEGRRVLDIGCGKGRFARVLAERGARVVGLDLSSAMLAGAAAAGLDCVLGSARRLPFRSGVFDAVMAVEVFEHLAPAAIDAVCLEARRVSRPGGTFVVIDKNRYALDARRRWLPSAALKWIDERRGLWMYPHRGPVRERWFGPVALRRRLERFFEDVRVAHLISRPELGRFPFDRAPTARLFAAWTARAPEGAFHG